jgi:hypothetical protein
VRSCACPVSHLLSCLPPVVSSPSVCQRCGYDPIDAEDDPDARRAAWHQAGGGEEKADELADAAHEAARAEQQAQEDTMRAMATKMSPW